MAKHVVRGLEEHGVQIIKGASPVNIARCGRGSTEMTVTWNRNVGGELGGSDVFNTVLLAIGTVLSSQGGVPQRKKLGKKTFLTLS